MYKESEPRPIQEDLFPDTVKEEPEKFDEQVVEVDRERQRVTIMIEGFELTYAMYRGKLELAAIQGATSKDEVPEKYLARSRRRAAGILMPRESKK